MLDPGELLPSRAGSGDDGTVAAVDQQVVTAKRYPRFAKPGAVKRFVSTATQLATLNDEIAAECMYSVPRDKKPIEGPSARLAEIVAHTYGNLRCQAKVLGETPDGRFIRAVSVAWDLEQNVAISYEVTRRIVDKNGRKYNDDMIGVTSNAAASIALRNSILKVVPKSYWQPIYLEVRKAAIGNAKTFSAKKAAAFEYLAKMGVTPDRILAALGVASEDDITLDHVATLRGTATAIKAGELSVDNAFPEVKEEKPTSTKDLVDELDGKGSKKPAGEDAPGHATCAECGCPLRPNDNPDYPGTFVCQNGECGLVHNAEGMILGGVEAGRDGDGTVEEKPVEPEPTPAPEQEGESAGTVPTGWARAVENGTYHFFPDERSRCGAHREHLGELEKRDARANGNCRKCADLVLREGGGPGLF